MLPFCIVFEYDVGDIYFCLVVIEISILIIVSYGIWLINCIVVYNTYGTIYAYYVLMLLGNYGPDVHEGHQRQDS